MNPMISLVMFYTLSGDMPPDTPRPRPTPPAPPQALVEDVPEEYRLTVYACDFNRGACIVSTQEIGAYVSKYVEAMEELKKLRAIKGCAKLEVVPKKIPPLKKEREI